MSGGELIIRAYAPEDAAGVIDLWTECDLTRPWNNPERDIQRKLKESPDLFLVGLIDGEVIASVMGGYEGHRGWINYLAVKPSHQKKGLGRRMMQAIEARLADTGCPKINLQVRSGNSGVVRFYERIGYNTEERISMAKRLVED